MKKEKKIKTYQRKTKSGKMVTVKAHTAKYDAAEKQKETAKKKGAGTELEEKKKSFKQLEIPFDFGDEKKVLEEVKEQEEPKKKVRTVGTGTNGPKPKKKETTKKETSAKESSEPAFTAAEFKEWYRGTGSAADKKVAKALRAQLGRAGYRKLEDEAIDSYSSRGHLSMFKRVSGENSTPKEKSTSKETQKTPKSKGTPSKENELSREKYGFGTAFKDNKAGRAWAMKHGEPFAPYGSYGRTYYKVGDDLYGNITGGHGGGIWGKVNPSQAKEWFKYYESEKIRKEEKKNPTFPTDKSIRAKLYKWLTTKGSLFEKKVPDKYHVFFTPYENPNAKGKEFIKDYEKSLQGKPTSKKNKPSYDEDKAGISLGKLTKEYGFKKSDIPILKTFKLPKPFRKFSEISQNAINSYSYFEGVSKRQAHLELMMLSKKEYNDFDRDILWKV